MQASATAYQYERFPALLRKAPTPRSETFITFANEPPTLIADQEEREQIELTASKFCRGLRYISLPPIWPRDNTALAAELNDLAIEQAEVDPLQAFRTLRAALRYDDCVAVIWNNLGLSFLEAGELESAERYFLKAIELDESLAIAWGNLGLTYLEAGHYPKAWKHFNHALNLDPNDPIHLNNLGILYLELEQPGKAKPLFDAAIAADPELHLAYYNLGMATIMLGFPEASQNYFSQGRATAEKRSSATQGAY